MFIKIGNLAYNKINNILNGQDNSLNSDTTINNLCGMMQVIIVRLGDRFITIPMSKNIFDKIEVLSNSP